MHVLLFLLYYGHIIAFITTMLWILAAYHLPPFLPSLPPPLDVSQAAMQMVSPQSGKPVIVNDTALLHSLQALYGDKLLYMMPDGTITSLPSSSTLTFPGLFDQAQKLNGDKHGAVVSPVKGLKRAHSPVADSECKGVPLPKRRRSSSLPDINKMTDRERETLEEEEMENGDDVVMRPRTTQPPNMIHLPKFSDPLIGFPTPSHQNSPLIHPNLAASPLTICSLPFRHQVGAESATELSLLGLACSST